MAQYLAKELPNFDDNALTVKKFGYGQSNPTYLLSSGNGQQYVLRKKPPGKLIKGAHAVEREFRIMRTLGEAGYTVPRTVLLCNDESVVGTPFYIMDFVKGPIPDNALKSVAAKSRKSALFSIARALAKLHSLRPEALGLVGGNDAFGKVGGFYERQMATLARTSKAQVDGSGGMVPVLRGMEEILMLFKANMPSDISTVIHGDWKPDNIIFAENGALEVTAVIDWELSTIGHPMSDLANMCLPYYFPEPNPVGYPVFDLTQGSGIPSQEEVHKVYCDTAGTSYPIANWNFYVAFSMFRLSIIVQGVAMRTAKGQASATSEAAGPAKDLVTMMVQAADFLCDFGIKLLKGRTGASDAVTSNTIPPESKL